MQHEADPALSMTGVQGGRKLTRRNPRFSGICVRKVQQWGSIKHDVGKKGVVAYPKPGAGDCPPVIGAYPASG
jgi:hypothetical protein